MRKLIALTGAAALLSFGSVIAQQTSVAGRLGLFVYPSSGQSAEQQSTDEQECYAWAGQTTGINPDSPPSSQRPPPAAPQEDTASAAAATGVRSAARNVLIANATDNDWEDAAAIGLVFGSSRGARNARRRNEQAQAQAVAQQQQASQGEVESFKKAFSACIEGREYTIR